MKRGSPKRKKHLLFIFILVIISAVVIVSTGGLGLIEAIQPDDEDDFPVALNHILSNELSNLKETQKMDSQIETFMRKWEINGASLAIMKDEKLIYAKGYGWADKERQEKTEVRHIFRIASVSKLITATAIMKLCEEGKISLNSKVFGENSILDDAKFRNFKDVRFKEITIEQLLRHKGGFSVRAGDPMFSLGQIAREQGFNRAMNTDEIISYVLSKRLGYKPGSGTRYSNVGYLILSKVIEKVSKMDYEDYVKEKILIPAGVYDMHIAGNSYEEKFPNEVKYYGPADEEPVEAFDGSSKMMPRWYGGNNIKALYGAGGWVASPSELLKLVAAIDGRDGVTDILSRKSVRTMTTSDPSNLPIGWAKCTAAGDWTRSGTLSGTSALIKYSPNGYSWVFITNTSSWKGARFPNYIDALFRGALQKVPKWPERDLFELKFNGNTN